MLSLIYRLLEKIERKQWLIKKKFRRNLCLRFRKYMDTSSFCTRCPQVVEPTKFSSFMHYTASSTPLKNRYRFLVMCLNSPRTFREACTFSTILWKRIPFHNITCRLRILCLVRQQFDIYDSKYGDTAQTQVDENLKVSSNTFHMLFSYSETKRSLTQKSFCVVLGELW